MRALRAAAFAAAALLTAGPVLAQSTDSAVVAELQRYLRDGGAIATAPFHFDARDWAETAALSGAIVWVATGDERIDGWVQSHRTARTDDFSRIVTPFGSWAAVGISVVALGGGLITRDRRLLDTGRDAVEAEILAAGIATPVLKYAIGRARPVEDTGAYVFKPFSGNGSLPSGHTTEAFAVASVLSAHAHGWVVPVVAYTLASCVGYARLNDREHWASDVLAGGVIGTLIGRAVVKRHAREAGDSAAPSPAYAIRVVPVVSGGRFGLIATAIF